MGNLAEGLLRLLSLLLVFLFGFLSFFGVLAGAGLFAYKGLTYDRLVAWGVSLPSTESVIQNPEVSLTSMTIEQAIKEVSNVKGYGDVVSIDFLLARYGIVLSDQVLEYLPAALRSAPLSSLTTKEGILEVLHGIPVSLIFDRVPEGVLSQAAKDALRDKTFGDVIDHDLEYLLGDVRLGYLMAPLGITYEYVDGVYIEQYKDPQNPTVLEVVAPLRLGEVLVNLKNKSELIGVVSEDIGDALLRQLLGSLATMNGTVSGILGDHTLNDIIVKDEATGEYNVNIFKLISYRTVGEILGYEPVYYDDDPQTGVIVGWIENGTRLYTGVKCGLAFCNLGEIGSITSLDYVKILEGFYLGYAVNLVPTYGADGVPVSWTNEDGTPYKPIFKNVVKMTAGEMLADGSPNVDKLLADVYVGELMEAELRINEKGEREWYKGEEKQTGVTGVFCDKLVLDVKNGELGLEDITLAKILGLYAEELPLYVKNGDGDPTPLLDGEGHTVMHKVWFDEKTNEEADAILGAIAEASIDSISTVISGLKIGDVTGNFSVPRGDGSDKKDVYKGEVFVLDGGEGEKVYLVEKATGALKALTDSYVNDISGALNDIKVGDAMNYYENDDGVWFKDPDFTDPLTGIQKALAPQTIGNLGNAMDDIYVGDAMNFYHDDETDTWYKNASLDPITGIQKVLAPKKIGEIDDAMDDIKIGDIMGWEYVANDEAVPPVGHWISGYDGDGKEKPATGIMRNFADLTINEMSDSEKVAAAVQDSKIGDAMGYYEDSSVSPSVWYTNSTKSAQPTGIMGILADTKISEVDTKINNTYIGELMGSHKNPADGKWYSDTAFTIPATPTIMNKISDATLQNVSSVMNNLTLGDVMDESAFAPPSSGQVPSFFYLLRWTDSSEHAYYRQDIPVEHLGDACNQTFKYVGEHPEAMTHVP